QQQQQEEEEEEEEGETQSRTPGSMARLIFDFGSGAGRVIPDNAETSSNTGLDQRPQCEPTMSHDEAAAAAAAAAAATEWPGFEVPTRHPGPVSNTTESASVWV
ncbi:uncharacterized protein P884DRAFT_208328, partial [Thermothelomyces heterothallicus CBS 202.75]|uniref:uncharacterized protein n=1 Tax=Thermothelomyces heterothallicus CBS 202.75 TaxID=1149848 RepID=UPI0037423068